MTPIAEAASRLFAMPPYTVRTGVKSAQWTDISRMELMYMYPKDIDHLRACVDRSTLAAAVATSHGAVIGYAFFIRRKTEICLIRIMVAEKQRRCGVGTALMNHIKERLNVDRVRIVTLVRETNEEAIKFFSSQKIGFKGKGIQEGSSENPRRDDIVFEFKKQYQS